MQRHARIRKIIGIIIGCAAVLLALVFEYLSFAEDRSPHIAKGEPVLTVQTPQKLSASQTDNFVVDVTVSNLGEALYPAASMNIAFDTSRLEFVGIREGNVLVYNGSKTVKKLPEWSYNVAACNAAGSVNVMYLDMTGGKNAFSNDLLSAENNVVLRLEFRLRGSVKIGDVCDLTVEDAVFAASDESKSLAVTAKTLNIRNGKIVIGE